MLILEHLAQLDSAAARAVIKQPKLKVIDFGTYEVTNSQGQVYVVTCKRGDSGQRIIYCSCEDKYPRKGNTVCYHIPPAVGAHILLALARRSVEVTY